MANRERGARVQLTASPRQSPAARATAAALLLAFACAPVWAAAGSATTRPPAPAAIGPAQVAPPLTLPPLGWGDWRGATLIPCSLETPAASEGDTVAPGSTLTLSLPDRRAPAPPRSLVNCSLGGPYPALTPPEALPRLRDVTRQADQDDTLRFLRGHW